MEENTYPILDKITSPDVLKGLSDEETKALCAELRRFLVSLGTPVTLAQMRVPLDRAALDAALAEATEGPDMAHIPYPITRDMVYEAMARVETL